MGVFEEKRDCRKMSHRFLALALTVGGISSTISARLQAIEPLTVDDATDVDVTAQLEQAPDHTLRPGSQSAGGGGPHQIVNQFLARLREGKKTIDGTHGSGQHAWELTTRKSAQPWDGPIEKMNQNPAFRASVAIGNDARALVLTKPVLLNSREKETIGVFDVVFRDGRWLVQKWDYAPANEAWATVRGFSRDPSVRFLVQSENIVGGYSSNGVLSCGHWHEFLPDGQYRLMYYRKAIAVGTWHLDGATLIWITEKGESRQEVTKLGSDGFTLRLNEQLHPSATGAGIREVTFGRFDLQNVARLEAEAGPFYWYAPR